MRAVSANFLAALNSAAPRFFILGKIEFNTQTMYFSSLPFPVTFLGQTYNSDSAIISFGPPRVSNSVDREIYELIIADASDVMQQELRLSAVGAIVSVYIGFFDSTGAPLLTEVDTVLAYKGTLDSGAVVVSSETKVCKILAASPMANLDGVGAYIVSKDGMDQVSTVDTSFDEVISGSKEVNLKWGKR